MSTTKLKLEKLPGVSENGHAAAAQAPAAEAYRTYHRILDWTSGNRMELINATARINEVVRESRIRNGIVHLQSLHTTMAVIVNEWQEALQHDMKTFLSRLVLRDSDWRHNDPRYSDCERKNADSHLHGMVLGQTICLQVRSSTVLLGTWQTIILVEFDGPRTRSLAVQVSGA